MLSSNKTVRASAEAQVTESQVQIFWGPHSRVTAQSRFGLRAGPEISRFGIATSPQPCMILSLFSAGKARTSKSSTHFCPRCPILLTGLWLPGKVFAVFFCLARAPQQHSEQRCVGEWNVQESIAMAIQKPGVTIFFFIVQAVKSMKVLCSVHIEECWRNITKMIASRGWW